ncbi:unnamed protein product [Caenorhabditis auriculariae]|uniref:Uncharacterized protein n=1 Tax=Caenorhabditis auriculariae TaxID=2777116 RepID=A0A8S1HD90_9PELO|nr:unnamed protein product [Caenorhabditis auriculariae]
MLPVSGVWSVAAQRKRRLYFLAAVWPERAPKRVRAVVRRFHFSHALSPVSVEHTRAFSSVEWQYCGARIFFPSELGNSKVASSSIGTLTRPRASYQILDLRLHCTLEPEVEASDLGSTASLWSLRLRSLAWALKAWTGDSVSDFIGLWSLRLRSLAWAHKARAGDSASDSRGGRGVRDRVSGSMLPSEYDVVRHPSRHIIRPEILPISPLRLPSLSSRKSGAFWTSASNDPESILFLAVTRVECLSD